MKTFINLFTALLILIPGLLYGQELEVEEMQFAESVENRAPVNVDTTFSAGVESVFCYTKVTGATDTTQITHVWYYEDEEQARISLEVKGETWRTWSSKKMLPEWTGQWRVDVENASGNVLKSKNFVIRQEN